MVNARKVASVLAVIFFGGLAWPFANAAEIPCRPAKPNEPLRVDFKETPLRDVVRFVSCAAQLNIVMDPPSLANHPITVIAPRAVNVKDLALLLRAALRHAGLVASQRGTYLLIRPNPDHVPSKRRSSKGR